MATTFTLKRKYFASVVEVNGELMRGSASALPTAETSAFNQLSENYGTKSGLGRTIEYKGKQSNVLGSVSSKGPAKLTSAEAFKVGKQQGMKTAMKGAGKAALVVGGTYLAGKALFGNKEDKKAS